MAVLQLAALLCTFVGVVLGAPDNRGTEFVIGYMANYVEQKDVELYITTSRTTTVNVHVSTPRYSNSFTPLDKRFTVTAGFVYMMKISNRIRAYGTEFSTKGILVTADDEVVVYGTNIETYSNDAFLAFPTDVLGMEYYTVSHHPTTKECEFMIIGVEDGTKVDIQFGQHSSIEVRYNSRTYYKNSRLSLKMNRLDTFQAQTYGDLTGTYITSDKKITVMSGNRRTSVKPGTSRDTLVDQMLPVDAWGKKFAIVPTPERTTGDNVRFVGSKDGTSVRVECSGGWSKSFSVNSRSYALQVTPSNQNCYVESTEAIMVILIVVSQTSSSEPADPALITIPPIEQYAADYTFSTPKYSYGEYKNFFMFIVKESEQSGLKLNGATMAAKNVRKIPNTEYVGGYAIVTPGTHTVRHDSPISVFGGFMYGTAKYETYGMPLGMRLAAVNTICIPSPTVVGDGIDNDCDGLIDEEMCTVENKRKDDDGDGVAEEDCATPPPIHGVWSAWTSYTTCSATCTPYGTPSTSGTKTRTRGCDNPAPKYDGKQCPGSGAETVTCSSSLICPTNGGWSSWGSWGTCSATCASGTYKRSRTCTNPPPQNGGATCPGSSSDSGTCNTGVNCPIDGGYSAWSNWGSCSVSCGGGTASRKRSCSNPSPQYGGAACSGSSSESKSCNTQACPIDGGFSAWSTWSSCPVTCGSGAISRSRTCDNPVPQHGGAICSGNNVESSYCVLGNCPIDGGFSDWTLWTTCTVSCGGGTTGRDRACTNPSPAHGGAACSGSFDESKACQTQNCPIDGAWTAWTTWSACGVSCGYSTHARSRTCTNPAPQYGGANCAGAADESQQCYAGIMCPIDGAFTIWSSWDACTVTCAGGTQDRARTCTNPSPQYNGAACSGHTSERQDCNTQNCPIDGDWTSWTDWSDCSSTCGPGAITRDRTCTNPLPQYGGAGCFGSPQESQWCNGTCTQHGAWGTWGTWTACSVTCDDGRRGRVRLCDNPAPTPDGNPCLGQSFEMESCNDGACAGSNSTEAKYVNKCPTGFFTCQSGSITCIDELFQCDCDYQCTDGSDELETWASCDTQVLSLCSSATAIGTSIVLFLSAILMTWSSRDFN